MAKAQAVTADLAQACADLAAWYPHIQALTTQPDTTTVTGRKQPASKPPWNAQAANAWTDIHAGARELEQNLRYQVTGTLRPRGGSDANTLRALDAIVNLAEATDRGDDIMRQLDKWITTCEQLPAIDRSEPWRTLPAPCPRCTRPMLRAHVAERKICCLGCGERGQMVEGTVSYGYVAWDDGTVT